MLYWGVGVIRPQRHWSSPAQVLIPIYHKHTDHLKRFCSVYFLVSHCFISNPTDPTFRHISRNHNVRLICIQCHEWLLNRWWLNYQNLPWRPTEIGSNFVHRGGFRDEMIVKWWNKNITHVGRPIVYITIRDTKHKTSC